VQFGEVEQSASPLITLYEVDGKGRPKEVERLKDPKANGNYGPEISLSWGRLRWRVNRKRGKAIVEESSLGHLL